MKILLLQPPIEDYYETALRALPLGLCYLKAALEKNVPGVMARVRDLRSGLGKRPATLPPELSYLADYYGVSDSSPFCTFSRYQRFGAARIQTMKLIQKEKPDLVGVSSLFSPYFREALEVARAAKDACRCKVVMGGAHASAAPQSLLADGAVDFVVEGEGERPLVRLVQALHAGNGFEGVPNLWFRTPDGDAFTGRQENFAFADLPAADLSDLAVGAYRLGKRPLCFVQASRGCPLGCTFCTAASVFGKTWRKRPVEAVAAEVGHRIARGYGAVDFEDDNLNLDPEYFTALLSELTKRFSGSGVLFLAMNGLSAAGLDASLLSLMKRAGFSSVNLPLVTADAGTRQKIRRPFSVSEFSATSDKAFELGLSVTAYQIIGLPGETLSSMLDTMALLSSLPVLLGLSVFYLAPGCAMAGEGLRDADFARARSTALGPDPLLRDTLYTLFICGRIINFIKSLDAGRSRISLGDALAAALCRGPRKKMGAEILRSLLDGKGLFAQTPQGLVPLPRFQTALFFNLLARTPEITTLSGGKVRSDV
ncbi:MAG: radical SAM protein [Thermodesulfobacteriota bacterium]